MIFLGIAKSLNRWCPSGPFLACQPWNRWWPSRPFPGCFTRTLPGCWIVLLWPLWPRVLQRVTGDLRFAWTPQSCWIVHLWPLWPRVLPRVTSGSLGHHVAFESYTSSLLCPRSLLRVTTQYTKALLDFTSTLCTAIFGVLGVRFSVVLTVCFLILAQKRTVFV